MRRYIFMHHRCVTIFGIFSSSIPQNPKKMYSFREINLNILRHSISKLPLKSNCYTISSLRAKSKTSIDWITVCDVHSSFFYFSFYRNLTLARSVAASHILIRFQSMFFQSIIDFGEFVCCLGNFNVDSMCKIQKILFSMMLSSYRIVIHIHHTPFRALSVTVNWKYNRISFLSYFPQWNSFTCSFDAKHIWHGYSWWVNEDRHPYLPNLLNVELLWLWLRYYLIAIKWENDENHGWFYYTYFLFFVPFNSTPAHLDVETHQPPEFRILCEYTTNAQNGSEYVPLAHSVEKK